MQDEEDIGEEERGSRKREQHMQRPRGWSKVKLQCIQEEEARDLVKA